jgi:toxin ParE1/3/4
MPTFSLTNRALEDLREIGRYTQERWGRDQRRNYLSQLDRYFHALAENPSQGQRCDEIRTGYRKFPSGRHVIFFRSLGTGAIEIVRVLHERMDVETHL